MRKHTNFQLPPSVQQFLQQVQTLLKQRAAVFALIPVLIIGLSFMPVIGRLPGFRNVRATVKKTVRGVGKFVGGPRKPSRGRRGTIARGSIPLTVKSTPTGATVKVNGQIVGTTPMTLKVAAGTYTVTVGKQGYAHVTRRVSVTRSRPGRVNLGLARARPSRVAIKPGSLPLAVKSNPSGSTVKVNGKIVGRTPMTLKVAAGTYTVTVGRSGYAPVTRRVTVKRGQAGRVTVALKRAPVSRQPGKKRPAAGTSASLLAVGARAPAIALKDRAGTVHRLSDRRGKQVVVLFVWRLDAQAGKLIKELDGRVRRSRTTHAGMVVVVSGNRTAIGKFVNGSKVKVPVLLGNEQIARTYRVPKGTAVVYVVSRQGAVAKRQAKSIQLAPIFAQQQKRGGRG